MKVVKKPLTDLHPPERNVRLHTDKQLKEFRRSVEMFGQIRPIVIDEGGTTLAGNGLFEAMKSMGRTEADCYVVTGLTEAQKKKLMLADNRVFSLGVDDMEALDAFVQELKDDLDIPGFEEDLLQAMVMEAEEATQALLEYGAIEPEQAQAIQQTREKYQAQEEAAAEQAAEITPVQHPPQGEAPALRPAGPSQAAAPGGQLPDLPPPGHQGRHHALRGAGGGIGSAVAVHVGAECRVKGYDRKQHHLPHLRLEDF